MKASLLKFLHYPTHASSLSLLRPGPQQTVLVDFSSPNIAKPFHLGHFRATVTGNFVRNVNEAMNHRVVAINYFGDWGTQFDILSRAFQQHGSWDRLHADPMRHLQEIYVRANQEQATSSSPSADYPQPCSINGDPDQLAWWTQVRQMTIAHLTQTYARMNVQFTAFEYESDYVDAATQLVDRLLVSGLASHDSDGVVCFRNSSSTTASGRHNSRIALRKSNGSTLYLTRDLAAAMSRYARYRFDRLHYVVENGQRLHFQHLCSVLQQLDCSLLNTHNPEDPSLDRPFSRVHVPFGRVQGASTRRGQGLTLADILDNAQQTVLRRMAQSRTTRVPSTTDSNLSSTERQITLDVADHLGVTCLVVEMLRQRRQKPILLRSFLGHPVDRTEPVDAELRSKSNNHSTVDHTDLSGLGVQYCHARLCSLERRAIQSGVLPSDPVRPDQCDLTEFSERLDHLDPGRWSVEQQQSALFRLHEHLVGFELALHAAYVNYEASILVQFATKLTTHVNVAWKQLPVLTCPDPDECLIRLATFLAARNVLAICLRLLGIRPLRAI